jgi:hypothetical protein
VNRALLKIAAFVFCAVLAVPAAAHRCAYPASYGLAPEELSVANQEFECWEIKYMKDYAGALSMDMGEYKERLRSWLPFVRDVEMLRAKGITPEKAEFLARYFVDRDYVEAMGAGRSDAGVIDGAISNAKNYMRHNRMEYKVGRVLSPPLNILNPIGGIAKSVSALVHGTAYYSFFIMPIVCVETDDSIVKEIFTGLLPFTQFFKPNFDPFNDYYPDALRPVGVIGKSMVNAFGEIVGDIRAEDKFGAFMFDAARHGIYVHGTGKLVGFWNSGSCNITDVRNEIRRNMACVSCAIFEIAFNTVSKVGFVMYDKLARYALDFMAVVFLLWTLWVFFDSVLRKGEPFEFVKTFFNRSMVLFLVACALSVSIRSKDNLLSYFLAPATDFMVGYNEALTSAIDGSVKGGKEWKCAYRAKYSTDSEVLFSREVKQNIVCTIERIADLNNMNSLVGKYNMKQGWRQVIGFGFAGNVAEGALKLFVGLGIRLMFLYMNLTVPFYFIESLFLIAIVVFMMPLFLAAYPFSKEANTNLVKKGFYTFLYAVFQIIFLTLMCSVVSMLMMYASGLDYYRLNQAVADGDQQEAVSQMMYMLSFDVNDLLQIVYVGIVCFYLMGKAVGWAGEIASGGIGGDKLFDEGLPKKWLGWTKNVIKYTTSVAREKVGMYAKSQALADKTLREQEKIRNRTRKIKKLALDSQDGEET